MNLVPGGTLLPATGLLALIGTTPHKEAVT